MEEGEKDHGIVKQEIGSSNPGMHVGSKLQWKRKAGNWVEQSWDACWFQTTMET